MNYRPLTANWRGMSPGLSLVELTAGMAILGLVSLMVGSVYLAHFRIFSNQSTSIDVASQNKIALDEMLSQIRQSETVVSTCTNCAGDTTGTNVLVLRLWPLDSSSEPCQPSTSGCTPTGYDYVVYKRDSGDNTKLVKKIVADSASSRPSSTKFTAATISNLQFAYDNVDPTLATEVTITVATQASTVNKTHTTTESSKAVLRNK